MKAFFKKYILQFKQPSGTSRGVLTEKETWFIILEEDGRYGIGECGLLRGLSADDRPDYATKVQWACDNINLGETVLHMELREYPSIQFGLEQALLSLHSEHPFKLFPSAFTNSEAPIHINGLIWMGKEQFMVDQIQEKIAEGFQCIKMKIGAIAFETELRLLQAIRDRFTVEEIELRVDANGAFDIEEAPKKLEQLSKLDLHSIEQPIQPKNWRAMEELCRNTPLPIALDEELIGLFGYEEKRDMLAAIKPQYLIFKPSFIGGFSGTLEWITLAEQHDVGWWVTSALESNIGLNAIAQWTFGLQTKIPQGLGTGGLFTNNFDSPLRVSNGQLSYRNALSWQPNLISDLCT